MKKARCLLLPQKQESLIRSVSASVSNGEELEQESVTVSFRERLTPRVFLWRGRLNQQDSPLWLILCLASLTPASPSCGGSVTVAMATLRSSDSRDILSYVSPYHENLD